MRLQQETVLQDSLKTIKTKIQLMMKLTNIKVNSLASVFQDNNGNVAQQDYRRAKKAGCRYQEQDRPGGGGQGEVGQVDDRARTQG
jgi:hypothetical protein